ncbi:MAG: IS1634 family transposase [Rhodoferax sp.]
MFIKVTSAGGRRYAQLVESFRNENGQPRQRTNATLGHREAGGQVERLIAALQRAQGHQSASPSLEFLEARSAGDVWALWHLWQSLGLEDLALAWGRSRSEIDVLACLRLMVFNRLCDPSSKLGVLRWLQTVALPRGFGFDTGAPEHQQLLRAMDVLEDHGQAIAQRLSLLMRPLIDQELSVVFYDLTTVRVQGESEVPGDARQHGMSKEGIIARQVMLSLVQTADGLPIAHEVHPGNTAEAPTLLPMIRELLQRWPLKRVVLVADRGLLSLNNLQEIERLQAELDAQGAGVQVQYVLAVPAMRYGEFEDELMQMQARHDDASAWVDEMPWQWKKSRTTSSQKAGIEQEDENAQEPSAGAPALRVVVAHDPQAGARRTQRRRSKIQELVALGQQWGGQLDAQDDGRRGRGRPLSDSGAKARLYHAVKEAHLAHLIKVDLKSALFSFSINEQRQRHLERLDGKLLVVTNTHAGAEEVIARYKSLADIERGFRTLKSDIEIGSIYHRSPKRIRAHALICFLALILHRVLRMRLKKASREESPTRLLQALQRVQQQAASTTDGQVVRGVTKLAPEQKDLFAAIGVPTPKAQEFDQTAYEAAV